MRTGMHGGWVGAEGTRREALRRREREEGAAGAGGAGPVLCPVSLLCPRDNFVEVQRCQNRCCGAGLVMPLHFALVPLLLTVVLLSLSRLAALPRVPCAMCACRTLSRYARDRAVENLPVSAPLNFPRAEYAGPNPAAPWPQRRPRGKRRKEAVGADPEDDDADDGATARPLKKLKTSTLDVRKPGGVVRKRYPAGPYKPYKWLQQYLAYAQRGEGGGGASAKAADPAAAGKYCMKLKPAPTAGVWHVMVRAPNGGNAFVGAYDKEEDAKRGFDWCVCACVLVFGPPGFVKSLGFGSVCMCGMCVEMRACGILLVP